jgi:hypothetical protein
MAGIFFVGVALLGLLGQGTGTSAGWVWPALLIVVGLAGLVAARPRRSSPAGSTGGTIDETG